MRYKIFFQQNWENNPQSEKFNRVYNSKKKNNNTLELRTSAINQTKQKIITSKLKHRSFKIIQSGIKRKANLKDKEHS